MTAEHLSEARECRKCKRTVWLLKVGENAGDGRPRLRWCAGLAGEPVPIDCPGGGYHEPASAWSPDGTGVIDAGDVGGDYQDGPAWSVRFTRPDRPGSLITVNVYAEISRRDGDAGRWRFADREYATTLTVQTEFLTCTDPSDPGGTETWSDYTYRNPRARRDHDYGGSDARRAARRLAGRYAAGRVAVPQWDGESTEVQQLEAS